MRKPIIFVALILTIVLVLAGCGGEPANETPEQVETPDVEDEVSEEPPVEVEEDIEEDMDNDDQNPFAGISNMDDYYYEMETQVGSEIIASSKIWVSGSKSRFESKSFESDDMVIMIMDNDEGVSYIYTPSQNMAMMMPFEAAEFSEDLNSEENVDYIENFKGLSDDANMQVENGNFEGEPVKIITGGMEGNNSKTWISTKTGFPLKSEVYIDGKLESVTTFKAFDNKKIDSSIFKLPDGVQIMEIPQQP